MKKFVAGLISGILLCGLVVFVINYLPKRQEPEQMTLDEAVKAVLPAMHAEHDVKLSSIDDDYYAVTAENDYAYVITFHLKQNDDEIDWIAENNNIAPEDVYFVDYAPVCILEKGTYNVLWIGDAQDYWDGFIEDMLYGDGAYGSGQKQE